MYEILATQAVSHAALSANLKQQQSGSLNPPHILRRVSSSSVSYLIQESKRDLRRQEKVRKHGTSESFPKTLMKFYPFEQLTSQTSRVLQQ
ncbi:hypothetical protein RvY_18022 [Ramazzottius varieornatus]|uniref:Uncharacterized protein n=1 Tax=Ramazzottius varieornatus TaxID=947166 RepID=A0A1D1WAI5_RAMVA|nr:hypothetical protein RvY_18022 [Ramazzottius varieornatus]